MRITIVENEMKQAIKDFVLGQLNVAEGMDITIDLKAGRGDDGFTADINIVPGATVAPKKTYTKRSAAPVVQTQDTAEEATEEAPGMVEEVSYQVEEAPSVEDTSVKEEPTEVVAETQGEATRPAGSLFAGLKRPQNG